MVWAGITYSGKILLIFIPEGIMLQGPQYRTFPENEVLTLAQRHLGEDVDLPKKRAPHLISPKKRMKGLRKTASKFP
ncbi:hypothetical protein ANCDUO_01753 [Ancylostoma duodenale]|uniref:Uncharacterized protein n=1 Tax=Ancylostoma duodenale TaxID=51022 RepID=A0A0C2H8J8_9BILA|nr:hypothetical protein ANCDUO_01753 [Ancylostoma duodenale]